MTTVVKLGNDHVVVPANLFTDMQRVYVLWNEGLLVERDPEKPAPHQPLPVGAREDVPGPYEDAPDESIPPAAPPHLNTFRPPTEEDFRAIEGTPAGGDAPADGND